jgi:hypothetical protein
LDYAQVLARIVELQGEQVDVSFRASADASPQVGWLTGRLRTSDAYVGHLTGHRPDACLLHLGEG